MPPPPFNWTTFLLGFAIALWIALVIFVVMPRLDPPAPAPSCPIVGCGGCCDSGGGTVADDALWIPSGNESYQCTNNDNGGGYIQDNGGGHVQDNGGGVVQDSGPWSPAPTDAVLGNNEERGFHQFKCSSNDNGGGYIQDHEERSVVVPMKKSDGVMCWSFNNNALAIKQLAINRFVVARYNLHRDLVLDEHEFAAAPGAIQIPNNAPDWVYCVVPKEGDPAQIVDQDNGPL